jgi:hypothetical protein
LFTRLSTTGNYLWNTGATGPELVVDTAGIYEVSIFEDCADQRERFFVVARDDCEKLHIPNAFTPNNDGKNDLFEVMAMILILFISSFSIDGVKKSLNPKICV